MRDKDKRDAYNKQYYIEHRQYFIDKATNRRTRVVPEQRLIIENYKLQHPCVDCGEADPIVLEFDHRDRATKSFAVCTYACNSKSNETLLAEIAKCDVRCANCHRRKTYYEVQQLKS